MCKEHNTDKQMKTRQVASIVSSTTSTIIATSAIASTSTIAAATPTTIARIAAAVYWRPKTSRRVEVNKVWSIRLIEVTYQIYL